MREVKVAFINNANFQSMIAFIILYNFLKHNAFTAKIIVVISNVKNVNGACLFFNNIFRSLQSNIPADNITIHIFIGNISSKIKDHEQSFKETFQIFPKIVELNATYNFIFCLVNCKIGISAMINSMHCLCYANFKIKNKIAKKIDQLHINFDNYNYSFYENDIAIWSSVECFSSFLANYIMQQEAKKVQLNVINKLKKFGISDSLLSQPMENRLAIINQIKAKKELVNIKIQLQEKAWKIDLTDAMLMSFWLDMNYIMSPVNSNNNNIFRPSQKAIANKRIIFIEALGI